MCPDACFSRKTVATRALTPWRVNEEDEDEAPSLRSPVRRQQLLEQDDYEEAGGINEHKGRGHPMRLVRLLTAGGAMFREVRMGAGVLQHGRLCSGHGGQRL
ncbi:hypothetical protein MTO96_023712, partial [Rhipicephalus appendiculatus]